MVTFRPEPRLEQIPTARSCSQLLTLAPPAILSTARETHTAPGVTPGPSLEASTRGSLRQPSLAIPLRLAPVAPPKPIPSSTPSTPLPRPMRSWWVLRKLPAWLTWRTPSTAEADRDPPTEVQRRSILPSRRRQLQHRVG